MRRFLALAFLFFAACASEGVPADGPDLALPVEQRTLGLNDVSILVPLPGSTLGAVLLRAGEASDAGQPIVPRALWQRLIKSPAAGPLRSGDEVPETDYDRLEIVAVRFDLCARAVVGICAADAPGQLRLVLQPIGGGNFLDPQSAQDTSIHALYAIPNAELAGVVAELRQLATLGGIATTAPLQPSPALVKSQTGTYALALRALVRRLADPARLDRLTFLAQPLVLSSIVWHMRGLDRVGADYQLTSIPMLAATHQAARLGVGTNFALDPIVDEPKGLALAVSGSAFGAAGEAKQGEALSALAAVENPTMHTADTVQCAACHVATIVGVSRARESGRALSAVAERYASSYDLSIAAGRNETSDRTVRMFGWFGREPFIAQRVANETANVLTEVEARYPLP